MLPPTVDLATAPVLLSIVSPVYRSASLVHELAQQVAAAAAGITPAYEIILVNDGSPDDAWERILEACAANPRVVGLNLSRNFGQHPAIAAGLAHSRGEWVVVMDADLQDRPDEIPNLYRHAVAGDWDVVQAQRVARQDGWLKRFASAAFYQTLSWLTGTRHDASIANFGIYRRRVVDTIVGMPEQNRVFPVMIRWIGFRRTVLGVQHAARPEGKSSYNLKRMLNLALDIMLAYSDKPLRLVVKLGFGMSLLALGMTLYVLVRALLGAYAVSGYASLMISIWFLAGLVISILGMLGLYIGKIFEGVKQRPIYIVRDKITRGA